MPEKLYHERLLPHAQVREKTDKFQQRRLDGFFKAGVKAADVADAAEELEQPEMPEVMAMEVEMEVGKPMSWKGNFCPACFLAGLQSIVINSIIIQPCFFHQ